MFGFSFATVIVKLYKVTSKEKLLVRLSIHFGTRSHCNCPAGTLWKDIYCHYIILSSLPFFTQLLMELETSAIVLTCVQAAVDPLIYTLVTRQFRSELSKILSSIPGCPLKSRSWKFNTWIFGSHGFTFGKWKDIWS